MPIYDYHCEQCQLNEERQVPVQERDEQSCLLCGKELRREPVSKIGLIFHGSGWACKDL